MSYNSMLLSIQLPFHHCFAITEHFDIFLEVGPKILVGLKIHASVFQIEGLKSMGHVEIRGHVHVMATNSSCK